MASTDRPYHAGRPIIPDAFRLGRGKCHQNLAGNESEGTEGGSWRVGRYRWEVPGSLLFRWWHGGLIVVDWMQHLMNVLGGLFRRYGLAANVANVTHDDVPTWSTTVRDVWGDQVSEVQRGGIFVMGETPKKDPLPGLWSWAHHRVNDIAPPTHARDGTHNRLETAAGHSDGAPASGVRCDISAANKEIPLPLPWMLGVLPHVE